MVKIDVEKYLDELRGSPKEESGDLYYLKEELSNLNEHSKIFDDFEKEFAVIDREMLNQIQDFGLLMRMRNLALEIKNKNQISDKLHSLHFSLNVSKNSANADIKNALNAFLYNNETKVNTMVHELNDFKKSINEMKKCQSNLLQKSLDNKLLIDSKYGKYIEKLHSIHKRQKTALISLVKLFLKLAKNQIKSLQRFKNMS